VRSLMMMMMMMVVVVITPKHVGAVLMYILKLFLR
jgi:hypothetical protein